MRSCARAARRPLLIIALLAAATMGVHAQTTDPAVLYKETLAREAMLRKAVSSGRLSADDVARAVVQAVKEDRFYVLTHPRIKGAIRARMEDILDDRAPRNPMSL